MLFYIKAEAFKMGLGVYTYYNWKDYSWADVDNLKMEGELQEGPVINMTWVHTVSLTLSAIAPFFDKYHADFDFKTPVSGYDVHVENASLDKSDIDIALSYAISPRFKIFAGAKYINLEIFDGVETVFTGVNGGTVVSHKTTNGTEEGGDKSFYSNNIFGGALCVNYSYPAFSVFAMVADVSCLYFSGEITSTPVEFNSGNNIFKTAGEAKATGSYNFMGSNIVLSLSYCLDSINTALSLGGRYQIIYNMYKSGEYDGSDKKFDQV